MTSSYYARRLPVTRLNGPQVPFLEDLEGQIAGMAGLLNAWDFHPERVTAGTNISIASKTGGNALVEASGYSNLVVGEDDLPYNGVMPQHGLLYNNTVLNFTGFPNGASDIFTVVGIVKSHPDNYATVNSSFVVATQSQTPNAFALYMQGEFMKLRVGAIGGDALIDDVNYPSLEWFTVIASWNNVNKTAKLAVNGGDVTTVVGTTESSAASNTIGCVGGHAVAVGKLWFGGGMIFGSTTAADGDLFDASRAADLERVRVWGEMMIGRYQQI